MAKSVRVGVIEIKITHPYYQFMDKLVNVPYNVVGFYYRDNPNDSEQNYSVTLFDIYSGRFIPYIPLNIRDIKMDPIVNIISMRSFDLNEELYKTFRFDLGAMLSKELMSSESSYSRLINLRRILLDSSERTDLEGYNIVNSIILNFMSQSSISFHTNNSLIASPLLSLPMKIQKKTTSEISKIFDILNDLYSDIFNILRDESFNHENIQDKITEGFKKNNSESLFDFSLISELPPDYNDEPYIPLVSDISETNAYTRNDFETIEMIRNNFNKILIEIERGEIPKFYLNELLDILSLDGGNLSKINGTIPAIINLDSYQQDNKKIDMILRSGQSIILPSRGADLGSFDQETLKEILWYLDNLIEYETTFVPLQNLVTLELAQRQKMDSKIN